MTVSHKFHVCTMKMHESQVFEPWIRMSVDDHRSFLTLLKSLVQKMCKKVTISQLSFFALFFFFTCSINNTVQGVPLRFK